ncbi:MAG: HAD family hydrolase [Thermoanaerobaculia bacterium]|nr:HAD family hydrolase [Thermoanaerobaculia bacterium]
MADKLKAIIFDLDGTLIDSNDLHAKAWQEAFEHYGVHLDYETVRLQIGKGGDLLVPDLLGAKEMLAFGEEIEAFRKKHFRENFRDRIEPFEGIAESFTALREKSVRIVVASSSNEKDLSYYLDTLGVNDLIDDATSADDVDMSKPAPHVFAAALEKLGTEPATTLVVGDTPYDILAAHRNSLPIAAVRCGGFPERTLEKAELIFDDVPEIVRNLGRVETMMRDLEE